jgi:hypothetical protein
MSHEVRYPEKMRETLKTFEWNGRGDANGAIRAIKMAQPICEICQTVEAIRDESPIRWTWMKDCEHGPQGMGPYWSFSPKVINTPKIVEDEDGEFVLDSVATRTKMVLMPNIVEIPITMGFESGEGLQKAAHHGFKVLSDIGLAPMCEMYGCGKAWPLVGTDFGNYCTEIHAKLCIADAEGVLLIINNPKKRSEQLRSLNV